MATHENTSTTTLTEGANAQLREIAGQLEVFSEVIAGAWDALAGSKGNDDRTVAAFAIGRIGTELTGIAEAIYAVTEQKGGAA
jgi:hypothetical protein